MSTPVGGDPQLADALRQIGEPAIEPLTAAFHSNDIGQRRRAADLLSQFDGPTVGGVMIEALGDKDPFVARAARMWLSRQAKTDSGKRASGSRRLAPDSDRRRETLAMLIAASRHKDAAVRRAAVDCLQGWDGPEAVGALLAACLDADADVSRVACFIIAGGNFNGQTDPARNLARMVLASEAGRQAVAKGGLSNIPADDLTVLLVQAMQPGTTCRREASQTLGRLRTPQATAALIAALPDAVKVVSDNARAGLFNRLTAEDIPAIEPARTSPHAHARANAVTLLRHIGGEPIIQPILQTLATETDAHIRRTAGEAVFHMDDPRLAWPLFDWTVERGRTEPGVPGEKPRGRYTEFYRIPVSLRTAVIADPAPFIKLLETETNDDRRALATELLRLPEQPEATEALRKRIEAGDIVVLQHAHEVFTNEELLAYEDTLVRGMNGRLAIRFEHSENPRVREAAAKNMPLVRVIYIPVFR
jgi:HEAT repeat protein